MTQSNNEPGRDTPPTDRATHTAMRLWLGIVTTLWWFPALGATLQTIQVVPTGAAAIAGTFALAPGREYALNRLIRQASDAGHDVDVVFSDGVYVNVRLQIIKEGIDTTQVYMPEPGEDTKGHTFFVSGKPYHYLSQANCNAAAGNCRVQSSDFALGPHNNNFVLLRAAHPHHAVFDAAAFEVENPDIDDSAIEIAGAYFGVPQTGRTNIASEPIRNIRVQGLIFRNYRNGIRVLHGSGIVIDDCIIEDIGTHIKSARDGHAVGVAGFSAGKDSHLILVKNSVIHNMWNAEGDTSDGRHWPELIHSVYDGNSSDVIFLGNKFVGSSGAMIKFGYYPTIRANEIVYQYGPEIWRRRGFFVKNTVVLTAVGNANAERPPEQSMQTFIDDNSILEGNSAPTEPAKGMVFINNRFENELLSRPTSYVAFLRQELVGRNSSMHLPGFAFAGNSIDGVPPNRIALYRVRGTPTDTAESFHADSETAKLVNGNATPLGDAAVGTLLTSLFQTTLRSPDTGYDHLVQQVIESGDLPHSR